MPRYYPAFLDLRDKPVVIIGGGHETEGKIPTLLGCGAQITIVAPEVGPETQDLAKAGQLTWLSREYQTGDLTAAWIAIVGSPDRDLNHRAADEARARRIMVNTVDDIPYCDFIAPAVIRRGDLTVAISTGGGSPAMARYARQELQHLIPEEWGGVLKALADARSVIRSRGLRPDSERWQECIDDELLALIRAGATEAATQRLIRMLEEHPQPVR